MKRKLLRGQGAQGMCLTLSVCDMFAASKVANELFDVIENHEDCGGYANCPYDQRKERYPEGQPKRIEVFVLLQLMTPGFKFEHGNPHWESIIHQLLLLQL